MDVPRFISILSIFFLSIAIKATELSNCIYQATYREHRLEKEDSVLFCFNKFKALISKNNCYELLVNKVHPLASTKLNEQVNAICFYETTPASDLKSCLIETKKFKISGNHDEAVFYCYQQFQDNITLKDCLKTANQLIFPLKKEYLLQHCENNSN